MNLFLTTDEQQAWNEHSHFFEPRGLLDLDACGKYLDAHLKQEFHPNHLNEWRPFLFALLKKSSGLPQAAATFARVYNSMRKDSMELTMLMGQLANEDSNTLRNWLQRAAQDATDTTARIFALRDAKAYFPHDDIKLYTNAQLLKIKPSVFIKKFTPTASDMEALLAVGVDFRKTPEYEELGTLLVQGIFISMYGKECETQEKNPDTFSELEEKYSARAAFDLMERYNIGIAPSELLQLLNVRYHGVSLQADALAYTHEALLSENNTMREYGLQLLDAVLAHQLENPDRVYNKGLLSIYGILDNENVPKNKVRLQHIKGAILYHVAKNNNPSHSTKDVIEKAPQLLDTWLVAWKKRMQDPDNQHLLTAACFRDNKGLAGEMGWLYSQHAGVRHWVHNTTKSSELVQLFETTFNNVMTKYDPKAHHHFTDLFRKLKHRIEAFSSHAWPQEKLADLKSSPCLTKWVLTYLFAQANMEVPEGLSTSCMPRLNQQPLQFLRQVYPEHQDLWNTMTKSNLAHPVHDLESAKKQSRQLFHLFSQAFLSTAPSLEQIESIAQLMETDALTVLLKSCEQAHALDLPQLDQSVFEHPL